MVGTGGLGQEVTGYSFTGAEFQICKMKASVDLFHNSVHRLDTAELYN